MRRFFCDRQFVVSSQNGLQVYNLRVWHQLVALLVLITSVLTVSYFGIRYVVRWIKIDEAYSELFILRKTNTKLMNDFATLHHELEEIVPHLRKNKQDNHSQDSSSKHKLTNYEQALQNIDNQNQHIISAIFVNINAYAGELVKIISSLEINPAALIEPLMPQHLTSILTGITSVAFSSKMTISHIVNHYQNNKKKYLFRSSFLENEQSSNISIKEAGSVLSKLIKLVEHLPINTPILEKYRISSNYGYRHHPIHKTYKKHDGIDLSGPRGTQIVATGTGKIIFTGEKTRYGNTIEIDHGYGVVSRFAHLDHIRVKPGQVVNAGTVIGHQGNTGGSTNDHLHYEIRYRNVPVNPNKFLYATRELKTFTASK